MLVNRKSWDVLPFGVEANPVAAVCIARDAAEPEQPFRHGSAIAVRVFFVCPEPGDAETW